MLQIFAFDAELLQAKFNKQVQRGKQEVELFTTVICNFNFGTELLNYYTLNPILNACNTISVLYLSTVIMVSTQRKYWIVVVFVITKRNHVFTLIMSLIIIIIIMHAIKLQCLKYLCNIVMSTMMIF